MVRGGVWRLAGTLEALVCDGCGAPILFQYGATAGCDYCGRQFFVNRTETYESLPNFTAVTSCITSCSSVNFSMTYADLGNARRALRRKRR